MKRNPTEAALEEAFGFFKKGIRRKSGLWPFLFSHPCRIRPIFSRSFRLDLLKTFFLSHEEPHTGPKSRDLLSNRGRTRSGLNFGKRGAKLNLVRNRLEIKN